VTYLRGRGGRPKPVGFTQSPLKKGRGKVGTVDLIGNQFNGRLQFEEYFLTINGGWTRTDCRKPWENFLRGCASRKPAAVGTRKLKNYQKLQAHSPNVTFYNCLLTNSWVKGWFLVLQLANALDQFNHDANTLGGGASGGGKCTIRGTSGLRSYFVCFSPGRWSTGDAGILLPQ